MSSERVRKYRRQKGWSQEQLGERVGFSQSKISKIENGDWDSLSDLRLIARALEIPIEELVMEDDEPNVIVHKKRLEDGCRDKNGAKPLFFGRSVWNVTL